MIVYLLLEKIKEYQKLTNQPAKYIFVESEERIRETKEKYHELAIEITDMLISLIEEEEIMLKHNEPKDFTEQVLEEGEDICDFCEFQKNGCDDLIISTKNGINSDDESLLCEIGIYEYFKSKEKEWKKLK